MESFDIDKSRLEYAAADRTRRQPDYQERVAHFEAERTRMRTELRLRCHEVAQWLMLHLPQNFPIPLTVMYVDGKYFTHYEGSVPAEMIEYDIQQAQKQLKSKSNEE